MRLTNVGFIIAALAIKAIAVPQCFAQLLDPIPEPIGKSTIQIELQPVASGLSAPNYLTTAPQDRGRLFVVDQAGSVRLIQNGQLSDTPFLNVSERLPQLGVRGTFDETDFDERGLLGLAFHPGFNDVNSAGHGKLYTYHSEPVGGAADFTVPLPADASFNHQSVISEWTVDATDLNRVDPNSRRELMRVDQPQFNHNAGMIDFGPDQFLYIAFGDGGQADDNAPGHGEIGNGQNPTNVLGSLLRIDVLGNNSINGQYGIPDDNPFVGQAGMLDEIFAYGFRNPFRFSFDDESSRLIVADVGQRNIEEVDIVTAGGNYGWRLKEGTFAFDFTTGDISEDVAGLPADLIDPVLQYDHDEGLSIIGGFVYRGREIPELEGKYVFGDFSTEFGNPRGRLLIGDLETGVIEELTIGLEGRELGLYVKGFGEDADGELHLLAGTNLGPFGSSGQVLRITPVPEPAAVLLTWIATLGLFLVARTRPSSSTRP